MYHSKCKTHCHLISPLAIYHCHTVSDLTKNQTKSKASIDYLAKSRFRWRAFVVPMLFLSSVLFTFTFGRLAYWLSQPKAASKELQNNRLKTLETKTIFRAQKSEIKSKPPSVIEFESQETIHQNSKQFVKLKKTKANEGKRRQTAKDWSCRLDKVNFLLKISHLRDECKF